MHLRALIFVLMVLAAVSASGAEPAGRKPNIWAPAPFYRVEYTHKAGTRDPMIDASATSTLVGGSRPADSGQIAAGDILTQFLEPITAEIRARLRVSGIAMSKPGQGRALLSGLDVATNDRFLMPVSLEVAKRVLGFANTAGLVLDYEQMPGGEIGLFIIVSEILPDRVVLRLPRLSPPLCVLTYDPQLAPEPRRLEAVSKK